MTNPLALLSAPNSSSLRPFLSDGLPCRESLN